MLACASVLATCAVLVAATAAVPAKELQGNPPPPPPAANYTCQAGQCVINSKGLPLAKCSQICGSPLPPPAPPTPPSPPPQQTANDIVQLAQGNANLSTLVALLTAANLTDALSSTASAPFTVFAPTNDAFDEATRSRLLDPANSAELINILTYHVVPQRELLSIDFYDNETIRSIQGYPLTVRIDTIFRETVLLDCARGEPASVTVADNFASNGVVHLIDRVLLPCPAVPNNIIEVIGSIPSLSTLATAINAALGPPSYAQLQAPLEPLYYNSYGELSELHTIFAPTNDAFAALPPEALQQLLARDNVTLLNKILTYHVVKGSVRSQNVVNDKDVKTLEGETIRTFATGGRVFVQDASVLVADVETSTGVIHVIDKVLMPTNLSDAFLQ